MPVRLGGLSLTVPRRAAERNYNSKEMALPLTKLIKGQSGHISRACEGVVRIRQKQRGGTEGKKISYQGFHKIPAVQQSWHRRKERQAG